MGKRCEPRSAIELPVRIFGTDEGGKIFSENVTTIDVSQHGAKLREVLARVHPDEIIGVTHGSNKVHFRVKWVGEPGTLKEGQVGLLNLTPEKPFWGLTLPSGALDNFRFADADKDQRQSVRVKCSISVELLPVGRAELLTRGFPYVRNVRSDRQGTAQPTRAPVRRGRRHPPGRPARAALPAARAGHAAERADRG